MGVLDASRSRLVMCWKRYCEFSTRCAMAHAAAKLSELQTVHRRFQTWCCNEILRRVLTDVANEFRDKGALDEEECFIDATFVMAKGGGSEIGPTKRGKGMKIMAIVDRHGLAFWRRSARTRRTITKSAWCSYLRLLHDQSEAGELSAIAPMTAIRWMRSCETTALS